MNESFKSDDSTGSGEFVRLLIEIQPQLRTFIGHLMPMVDSRADLLQEVNMVVWQKRESFDMSGDAGRDFRNWSYTIARFVVMNHQRKVRRDGRLVFGEELMESLASDFEESDPSIAERMPALRRCLRKVPESERHLLLERYNQHGAIQEKARTEGRSGASLRGSLFRLRIALRRCVEQELLQQPEA